MICGPNSEINLLDSSFVVADEPTGCSWKIHFSSSCIGQQRVLSLSNSAANWIWLRVRRRGPSQGRNIGPPSVCMHYWCARGAHALADLRNASSPSGSSKRRHIRPVDRQKYITRESERQCGLNVHSAPQPYLHASDAPKCLHTPCTVSL